MNAGKLHIKFRVKKNTDNVNTHTQLATFYVKGKNDDFQETIYHDMDDDWVELDFDTDVEYCFRFGWRPQFAVKWHGPDELMISKIWYAEDKWEQLDPANGDPDYQEMFVEEFRRSLDSVSPWYAIGWLCWEPWKYGISSFNALSDYVEQEVWQVEAFNNHQQRRNIPRFPCLYPFLGENYVESWIQQTGTGAILFDSYPISTETTDLSEGDNNVQEAWDNFIEGEVHNINWVPTDCDYRGISQAKDAAVSQGVPLWAGIQAKDLITPIMLRCHAFLSLSFGVEGFFYCYYAPIYHRDGANDWFDDDHNDWRFNGAQDCGLTTFCPNIADDEDTLITSTEELEDAHANADDPGWLRPNPKWWAAKEFNEYVRSIESSYVTLDWEGSDCATGGDVGFIRDIQTSDTVGVDVVYDQGNETWVQVGCFNCAFDDYFILVNRRCDEDGDRTVNCEIAVGTVGVRYRVFDIATFNTISDEISTRNPPGPPTIDFEYWLQPGEGRLFFIHDMRYGFLSVTNDSTILRGNYIVDNSVTIATGARLTLNPGVHITFADDGWIDVQGSISAKGDDTDEDSLIVFSQLNSDKDGYIRLKGSSSSADTLMHCKFRHLKQGLNVSKTTGTSVYISDCEFCYCENEGVYVSNTGGNVTFINSEFHNNGSDGMYLHNCNALIDTCKFYRNEKNGIYAYNVNSSSKFNKCDFNLNGSDNTSGPKAGIRCYSCSPTSVKNDISLNVEYGIFGANGSHPVLYNGSYKAANTVIENGDHETYWESSYPMLDYGHNNFNTEDDTIVYINGPSPTTFYARKNYWGGGPPNTGSSSKSYIGPGGFVYNPYDSEQQTSVGDEQVVGRYEDQEGDGNRIANAEEDAHDAFRTALALEEEHPLDAIDAYRQIISRYPRSSVAPVVLDRILWLIRDNYQDNARNNQLTALNQYFDNIADTSRARGLAWKAKRAALWTLAAMHNYDAAIAGFEEIVENADCLADSVFAVIDIGTLHLEAQQWAERDTMNRVQAMPGRLQYLCPADWQTHRKHTDELLAMLGAGAFDTKPLIPDEYFLAQNYPNPFNSTTRIRYGLPEESLVCLTSEHLGQIWTKS